MLEFKYVEHIANLAPAQAHPDMHFVAPYKGIS
jgi:hypothetical protein